MQIDRRVGQIFSCYICCSLRQILGFPALFQSVIFNQSAVFFKTFNLRSAREVCHKILQDVSQAAFKNAFKTFGFALERGMLHAEKYSCGL